MTFRCGHAQGADWEAATAQVVEQLGGTRGIQGLGFVYLSDRFSEAAPQIVERLRRDTGVAHWVGTVGIGVLASGVEYIDQPALVAMITDWASSEYSIFSGRARLPAAGSLSASGATAAHVAIVHGDPNTADMPELIDDMARKVDSGFLVGGLSSSRTEPFQIADEVISGGLSGVVLSAAIPVQTRLTQGCSPLPERHTITEGEGNLISKIDGRPALDVFKEAAGEVLARDLRRAAFSILVGLPVAESDVGDYLVRNLIGIDPKSKVIAIGAEVEAGQPLLFCKRDGAAARQDLERMLTSMRESIGPQPKGALYYACVARGENMFGRRSAEMEIIREHLGDLPVIGFFANGEISHDRLYGYTGVLTVFS